MKVLFVLKDWIKALPPELHLELPGGARAVFECMNK
jgi:hypothetical protein